jgi:hypothetical protein
MTAIQGHREMRPARSWSFRFTIRRFMVLIAILSLGLAYPDLFLFILLVLLILAAPFLLLVCLIVSIFVLSLPGILVYLSIVIPISYLKKQHRTTLAGSGRSKDAEIRYL